MRGKKTDESLITYYQSFDINETINESPNETQHVGIRHKTKTVTRLVRIFLFMINTGDRRMRTTSIDQNIYDWYCKSNARVPGVDIVEKQ